jgi:alkane 1-monooxygenase
MASGIKPQTFDIRDGEGAVQTYALSARVEGRDTWHDRKRYFWILGLVVPLLPFGAVGLYYATGLAVMLWLGPVVFLGIIPLIDLVAGEDASNPPDEVVAALEEDRYYRWVVYAYLPFQYLGFIGAMWIIGASDISVFGKLGLALSVGVGTGIAINTAHELGHKKESVERGRPGRTTSRCTSARSSPPCSAPSPCYGSRMCADAVKPCEAAFSVERTCGGWR